MPASRSPMACRIELPERYRQEDVLAFHRRDKEEVAERVGSDTLHKGLIWRGQPAGLHLRFASGRVEASLSLDGESLAGDQAALASLAHRMLGLEQPVEAFEAAHRQHPLLGRLIAARPGLRVPLTATPFEALCWAITGQQISVQAAVSIRRKLIRLAGRPHRDGLWCYPDAAAIAACSEADLRQAGFSQAKATTLMALSYAVLAGTLPLDTWQQAPAQALPAEAIRAQLLQIRGIGPWTINYGLLRGFGWLDGSLHGDAAVRRKLQILLGSAEAINEKAAQRWLEPFAPWRALVGAHLWAMPA
jgi:DNA-3-methyladenine glycosylase II